MLAPCWRRLLSSPSDRAAHDHILCSSLLFTARFFSHFLYMQTISPVQSSSVHVVDVFPPSLAGVRPEPGPVPLHRRSLKGCYSINLSCSSLKPLQLLAPTISCGRELCHLTKCCVINCLLLLCCLWEVQGKVVGF